jgi:hypothetical protein
MSATTQAGHVKAARREIQELQLQVSERLQEIGIQESGVAGVAE